MNVYRTLKPTQFLPRLLGAAPFYLSNTNVKFSRLGLIWPFIQVSIACSLLYAGSVGRSVNLPLIKMVLLLTKGVIECTVGIFSIFKDAFCQKRMINVILSIDDYDKKTGYDTKITGIRENKQIRFWSYVYPMVFIVLSIFSTDWTKPNEFEVGRIIIIMQIDIPILMFSVFVILLGMRFRHLNRMIEEDRTIEVQEPRSTAASDPERLRALYTGLILATERINDIYSDRLFLWAARTTLVLVALYYLLFTENDSALTGVQTFLHILPVMVELLLFTRACDFTVNQANSTAKTLLANNIRRTAQIDRGRKEIFTMSLYMALRPFQFSALGFFNVDLSLTYAIITIAITYITLCLHADSSG